MNGIRYRRILYFISLVILLTLCVQGYWSYKNYLSEKQQLITDVQVSLDNALDSYYTRLAKQNTLAFISDSIPGDSIFMGIRWGNIFTNIDSLSVDYREILFDDSSNVKKIAIFKTRSSDSFNIKINERTAHVTNKRFDIIKKSFPNPFEMLTSKIVVSFSEDSLSLTVIDSLIQQELDRKSINVTYGLRYTNHWGKDRELRESIMESSVLTANAGSSFLIDGSNLVMHYDNITRTVLRRNATSLFLSFLLVTSIISSLLYLLKIIQKQKQLSEIKNDLISNITHEFKTPLATISVALEGIQRFNRENDTEKSKKYVQMSRQEVEKLSIMVEKLLETATLDSNNLQLNLEETNLVTILEKASIIPEDLLNGKEISFTSNVSECIKKVDRFHFENAINNIVDNALKYGGDMIEISLQQSNSEIQITIKDNGTSLTKTHAIKIFEKFYRVPKGNTHDVKGFGIGLYYTKNIIEKHKGTIKVLIKDNTFFIITLPNG